MLDTTNFHIDNYLFTVPKDFLDKYTAGCVNKEAMPRGY